MLDTTLTIRVPFLPPNINRHSRNWYTTRHADQEYAGLVCLSAIDARNRWEVQHGTRWLTLPHARIEVYFRTNAERGPLPDTHNLYAGKGLKAAIDRLTDRHYSGCG